MVIIHKLWACEIVALFYSQNKLLFSSMTFYSLVECELYACAIIFFVHIEMLKMLQKLDFVHFLNLVFWSILGTYRHMAFKKQQPVASTSRRIGSLANSWKRNFSVMPYGLQYWIVWNHASCRLTNRLGSKTDQK